MSEQKQRHFKTIPKSIIETFVVKVLILFVNVKGAHG
jgi:hypothetical protein